MLDSFESIPMGTGYEVDGSPCAEMPAEVSVLERVQPTYQTMPGWQAPTGSARSLADLPKNARAYLDRIEELVGVGIRYVSVGTRRDQIISIGS